MNRNVSLCLLYTLAINIASSLFGQVPLTAYVLLITKNATGVPSVHGDTADNNVAVGLLTGCQGVINLILALPSGILADRIGRDGLLKVASIVLIIASIWMAFCLAYLRLHYSHAILYYSLLGAAALFGVFMGIATAPLDALFADSIESGARSKYYAWRSMLRNIGNTVGPLISLIVFAVLGNEWSEGELLAVLYVGIASTCIPAFLLLCFRDDKSLGAASEGLLPSELRAQQQQGQGQEGTTTTVQPLPPAPTESSTAAAASQPPPPPPTPTATDNSLTAAQQHALSNSERTACCGLITPSTIAPLLAFSDLLGRLGAGMTVKFFALFFWRDMHLGPMMVNGLYVAAPLGIALCTLLAQRLSLLLGRLQTTLLCKFLGVGLLLAIAYLPLTSPHAPYYILPMYLVRTWLMNAPTSLTKSVLNDYVPKKHRYMQSTPSILRTHTEPITYPSSHSLTLHTLLALHTHTHRAKWNSLESLNTFSWSGSAALGGLLIDKQGYQRTFVITAIMQFVAALFYVPLLALVQAESGSKAFKLEEQQAQATDDAVAAVGGAINATTTAGSNGLREGLLAAGTPRSS